MNFHEYQAKKLFAAYDIPVPAGTVATTPLEAVEAARGLGGRVARESALPSPFYFSRRRPTFWL